MTDYEILYISDFQKWNDYLIQLPIEQQDIYFTPEYYKLYEDNGDGKATCFVFNNNNNIALYPFLLNSVNNLGYDLDKIYFDIQGAYGYNGVISNTNCREFRYRFYKTFNEYCQSQNIIAEFTRFHPLLRNEVFSRNELEVIFDRKTVFIDLQADYSKIFDQFQTTTRKQIKRAYNRYNLEVEIVEKSNCRTNSFLEIYHNSLKRINATEYLYFNKKYFEELFMNTKSICFYANYEGKPIASIIVLYNGSYIHGHLGGALTDYLSLSPYSFLYAEMIKLGQKIGCKMLHVGGGATTNPDDSLFRFKSNFSHNYSNFYIGRKIYNHNIYNIVVNQWKGKYPEKIETYKNFVLKYRY